MNIPAKPIQFGDNDRCLGLARSLECRLELRSPVERVSPFAGFDFGVLADDLQPFGLCEIGDGGRWASSPRPERPVSGWKHDSRR